MLSSRCIVMNITIILLFIIGLALCEKNNEILPSEVICMKYVEMEGDEYYERQICIDQRNWKYEDVSDIYETLRKHDCGVGHSLKNPNVRNDYLCHGVIRDIEKDKPFNNIDAYNEIDQNYIKKICYIVGIFVVFYILTIYLYNKRMSKFIREQINNKDEKKNEKKEKTNKKVKDEEKKNK